MGHITHLRNQSTNDYIKMVDKEKKKLISFMRTDGPYL